MNVEWKSSRPEVCPTCGSCVREGALPTREYIAQIMIRFGITRTQALLFLLLWRARGRVVTFEAYMDMQDALFGRDSGHAANVRSIRKHLGQRLKGHPVRIRSVSSLGYVLEIEDPTWHWDTA